MGATAVSRGSPRYRGRPLLSVVVTSALHSGSPAGWVLIIEGACGLQLSQRQRVLCGRSAR